MTTRPLGLLAKRRATYEQIHRYLGRIDPANSRLPHRQIADRLCALIDRGILPPGAPLPDQLVLAGHYRVDRHTIRTAITYLTRWKTVVTVPDRGTWVWPGPPASNLDLWDTRRLDEQLAEVLAAAIRRGRWPLAEALPSRRALSAQYDVCQKVMQSAIKRLVQQGIVHTVPRMGTFIVPTPDQWSPEPRSARGAALTRGNTPSTHRNAST